MISRTTLSLDKAALQKLQQIVKNENFRSLSQMVKDILEQFIESYEKKKEFEKMAKDYQKYSQQKTSGSFAEMEQAALTDLINRNK